MKRRIPITLALAAGLIVALAFISPTTPSARAQSDELSASALVDAAASGGSLDLDATRYAARDLISIASAASRSPANKGFVQVRLTVRNAERVSGRDLGSIASAGSGAVTFILGH